MIEKSWREASVAPGLRQVPKLFRAEDLNAELFGESV